MFPSLYLPTTWKLTLISFVRNHLLNFTRDARMKLQSL